MRWPPRPVVLAACLSLLGVQLGGVHLHANAEGFDAVPHGTHVHGRAPHRHDDASVRHDADGRDAARGKHDHGGDRDVAVVELGAGAQKLPLFLVGPALALPLSPPSGTAVRVDAAARPSSARPGHWRPPLRGPPRDSVQPRYFTR